MASTVPPTQEPKSKHDGSLQIQAYEALSSFFRAHDDQVVAIEVLSPAIQPPDGILMHDGLFMGIPKKVLALAFIEARKRFFDNIKNPDAQSLVLDATKVMLLFDPEHLTAANFRKRRLVTLQPAATQEAQLAYKKAMKCEFCFLDSILTSPLHRQSKSPTLWHHRLWLRQSLDTQGSENIPDSITVDFWRTELDSVCKSGERHPKNYYAWQYARRSLERVDDAKNKLQFAQHIKAWCFMHPSDISGWACLLHVVLKVENPSNREEIVQDVLDYAIKLTAGQESLWIFVRTILAHETLRQSRDGFILMLAKFNSDLKAVDQSPTVVERIQQALRWIETSCST